MGGRPGGPPARPAACELLRQWREEQGLAQHELAESLGLPQNRISEWERGTVIPGLRWAFELEDATGGAVPARAWLA